MSVAMPKLYKQMFKSCYKSYYTKEEDEYRTIANCGILSNTSKEVLSEIDIGKAYTSGLIKIDKVPIFNEFDIFQPYTGE